MTGIPLHRTDFETMLSGHGRKEPVNSPGHDTLPLESREGGDARSGATSSIAWGARTDVGLVRGHNEDSFLVQPPVFAVCDGMGGHAAGEVASSISVQTISARAPIHADDVLLGAAVEAANAAVIEGAAQGLGKPGMGCTASCVHIEGSKVAVAHVGDSRIYLLHQGTLVRLTHDHSYVEELVDAGEITADEARVHPSRSVITRALGSDPDMYADHFTLDISAGDRIVLCSDGLSSMVEDSEIEAIAVSSALPQTAADNLVAAALEAGGHDNVTVVVVDVNDDGLAEVHRRQRRRWLFDAGVVGLVLAAALIGVSAAFVNASWYLADHNGTVAVYHGVQGDILGFQLSSLSSTSSVETKDLPTSVQDSLRDGLRVGSEEEARVTIESYRDQIDADKSAAAVTADRSKTGTDTSSANPATPEGETDGGRQTTGEGGR